jgi:hypothetical protein
MGRRARRRLTDRHAPVRPADVQGRAPPWQRSTDQDHFDPAINLDGTSARYVTIVLGAEGVQHGLVLYPGGRCPYDMPWCSDRSLERGKRPTTDVASIRKEPGIPNCTTPG